MSKKHSISQLIRDEVEQQELFKLDEYTTHITDWAVDTCSGQIKIEPKVVLDKTSCPEQKMTCPEQKHWVETYSPSKRKSHSYYRYVYRKGGTLYHCHIRGGSSTSDRAIALKAIVLDAIALGKAPQEIVRLIKGG